MKRLSLAMLAAVMFFFIPIFSSTFALSVPEPPKGMMILDLAGFLPDSDIKQIDSRLKEIKKKTTSEIGIILSQGFRKVETRAKKG